MFAVPEFGEGDLKSSQSSFNKKPKNRKKKPNLRTKTKQDQINEAKSFRLLKNVDRKGKKDPNSRLCQSAINSESSESPKKCYVVNPNSKENTSHTAPRNNVKLSNNRQKKITSKPKSFAKANGVLNNKLNKKQQDCTMPQVDRACRSSDIPKKGPSRKRREESDHDLDFANIDEDRLDEALLNAKKKRLDEDFKNADKEQRSLFSKLKKKEKIMKVLASANKELTNRKPIKTSGALLRDRMMGKLKAAQFRFLNEKLYTSTGTEAQQLFQEDPSAFTTYHNGYRQQLEKWPVKPLDVIVKRIKNMPKTFTIADMGCGEATLATLVPHSVRSFDLVSASPVVEVCDMARTPLLAGSVDAAVYCLALMGTRLTDYLLEANRVLKTDGLLLIAEVESRFDDVEQFANGVQRLGFKLLKLDKTHQVFFFMEFKKVQGAPTKKVKQPVLTLKPCLYKRR